MECISIIASWICTYMHVRWFIVIINKKKVENGAVLISYTIYIYLALNGLFVIKKIVENVTKQSVCTLEETSQAHICSQINRSIVI